MKITGPKTEDGKTLHLFWSAGNSGKWDHATAWCWCWQYVAISASPSNGCFSGVSAEDKLKWDVLPCHACNGSGLA